MPLYYQNQPSRTAFDAVAVTSAYTGNQYEFNTAGFSKLSLSVDYAMGAEETANTLEIQLEESPDGGTTWYVLPIDETSTISEISARAWQMLEGNLNILVDIAYLDMRLSIKETGVAANAGTVSIQYVLSGL